MAKPRIAPDTCTVDGCNLPYRARGYCSGHWTRWNIKGDPLAHIPLRSQGVGFTIRFWREVDKNGSIPQACPERGACWLWNGYTTDSGYGLITPDNWDHKSSRPRSHRISLELYLGRPLGKGMWALHHCDNPPCVNPDHLYEGTRKDNERDKIERDRVRRGRDHPSTHLTEDDVVRIRERVARGERQVDLCGEYEMSPAGMSQIVNRKTWVKV